MPTATATALTALSTIASLFSTIGSGSILICYSILPLDYHFRHILILNLATSDFLNSLKNLIAGIYVLSYKNNINPGRTCHFIGFVTQVAGQATDCAILAIAITTVLSITKRGPISTVPQGRWKWGQKVLLCCVIWAFPFFTGFLALGMGWYKPVTGEWCWLETKPVYLRLVLMHGWRYLFIITEVGLYVYLNIHLRRHYQRMAQAMTAQGPAAPRATQSDPDSVSAGELSVKIEPITAGKNNALSTKSTHWRRLSSSSVRHTKPPRSILGLWSFSWTTTDLRRQHHTSGSFSADTQYQAIQRVLLLNAYPFAYIVLWIPGLANRTLEATGRSNVVLQFLQTTTLLVGLANALTYGWNERIVKQLKDRFPRR
ncbi:hypothetical protein AX15_007413 [Amanita polypyramis BW_CC]|nr:hypothetical protein AX15_007413 [Amanita polypyramis BW_CC]